MDVFLLITGIDARTLAISSYCTAERGSIAYMAGNNASMLIRHFEMDCVLSMHCDGRHRDSTNNNFPHVFARRLLL